jgi:hypothetical protein
LNYSVCDALTFTPRFRRGAIGWRSDPAITRIKEAHTEIKAFSRKDRLLAAEGAVLFLSKPSAVFENIDSNWRYRRTMGSMRNVQREQ